VAAHQHKRGEAADNSAHADRGAKEARCRASQVECLGCHEHDEDVDGADNDEARGEQPDDDGLRAIPDDGAEAVEQGWSSDGGDGLRPARITRSCGACRRPLGKAADERDAYGGQQSAGDEHERRAAEDHQQSGSQRTAENAEPLEDRVEPVRRGELLRGVRVRRRHGGLDRSRHGDRRRRDDREQIDDQRVGVEGHRDRDPEQ
jgi:hypothetical protein